MYINKRVNLLTKEWLKVLLSYRNASDFALLCAKAFSGCELRYVYVDDDDETYLEIEVIFK